ncbi:MAG TPA: hypothetical protein VNN18_11155 [Candidatus Xenobia bacterium]|nr:hypothetical protein [Candidatus Xenobia bacterium]
MARSALLEEIRQLKSSLEELERRLSEVAEGDLPTPVLEDFKKSVDHVRLTLWVIISAMHGKKEEMASTVARFRVRRTKDLCQQLVADINAGKTTSRTPELPMLLSTLKETHERVQRLLSTSR